MYFDKHDSVEEIESYQKMNPLFRWDADQPPRMNPEVKSELVDALRSGKYLQGKRALRTVEESGPDRFCCLGVATDLQVQKGVGKWLSPNPISPTCRGYSTNDDDEAEASGVLPRNLTEKFNLSPTGHFAYWFEYNEDTFLTESTDNCVSIHGGGYELTALNDAGFTFEQIVDVINYFL